MRIFHCDRCGLAVFFENTHCQRCGGLLAYLPDLQLLSTVESTPAPPATPPTPDHLIARARSARNAPYVHCANRLTHNVCNWAVPLDLADESAEPLCRACRLNLVIPDLAVPGNLARWARLESAKRRLVANLLLLRLPLDSDAPDLASGGLRFKFLADPPQGPRVLTGHAAGVITLNIIEADDAERERIRVSLHEPYRTLLGHLRHESGHFYWTVLVDHAGNHAAFRDVFGDERTDYAESLKRHYAVSDNPADLSWQDRFVSRYAAVHPWEDFAETFAHYLHITDTLETSDRCGLTLTPPRPDEPALTPPSQATTPPDDFSQLIDRWLALAYALNNLNRGMGLPDAYPFVLSPTAISKLHFIHDLVLKQPGAHPSSRPSPSPTSP